MNSNKRQENEKKFPCREELSDGSRMYWFEIKGRLGWNAKYLKIVDQNEITLSFWQEITDEKGVLVEIPATEMKIILDNRLQEDELTYITSKQSVDMLKKNYGL